MTPSMILTDLAAVLMVVLLVTLFLALPVLVVIAVVGVAEAERARVADGQAHHGRAADLVAVLVHAHPRVGVVPVGQRGIRGVALRGPGVSA